MKLSLLREKGEVIEVLFPMKFLEFISQEVPWILKKVNPCLSDPGQYIWPEARGQILYV